MHNEEQADYIQRIQWKFQYLKHREHILEQKKEYRNRPEVKQHYKALKKQYNIENKEIIHKRKKEYYARPEVKEHTKKLKEQYKKQPGFKEHRREYYRQWMIDNWDRNTEIDRKWRENNKEHVSQHMKKYNARPEIRERNLKYWREYNRTRRNIIKRRLEYYKNLKYKLEWQKKYRLRKKIFNMFKKGKKNAK